MSWVQLIWYAFLIASPIIYTYDDPGWPLLFGNIGKIFALMVASISLTATQSAYSSEDTPYKAWTSMASGMWLWFFAQLIFAFYKLGGESPYPSLADVFFVIAYLPLIAGLIFLIKDFRSTGLPMGSKQSYILQGGVMLGIYIVIFFTLLKQFVVNDDSAALKLLNIGYPTLDFVLISITSVLIRISWVLRGGSLAKSWILLGSGFTVIWVADILYAIGSWPVLDVMFFSAYFLIGLAGVYQVRMLRH